jgi:hypothetical protein
VLELEMLKDQCPAMESFERRSYCRSNVLTSIPRTARNTCELSRRV